MDGYITIISPENKAIIDQQITSFFTRSKDSWTHRYKPSQQSPSSAHVWTGSIIHLSLIIYNHLYFVQEKTAQNCSITTNASDVTTNCKIHFNSHWLIKQLTSPRSPRGVLNKILQLDKEQPGKNKWSDRNKILGTIDLPNTYYQLVTGLMTVC